MSTDQSKLMDIVQEQLDIRVNGLIRWMFFGLLAVLATIIVAAFRLGIQVERVNATLKNDAALHAATAAQIADIEAWRRRSESATARGFADRFTATDYDTAASLFNMRGPMVMLPFMGEIRRVHPLRDGP